MFKVSRTSSLIWPVSRLVSATHYFSVGSGCSASQRSSETSSSAVPRETEILIIGGGLVGQSIAYFLKREQPHRAFSVTVVERDPSYAIASSALSTASFRQQFSLSENVRLSLFMADFLRTCHNHLAVEGADPVEISYNHAPYLFLAESDEDAAKLEKNVKIQRKHGAVVSLLKAAEIKRRYPWLNVDNVKVGSIGQDNEGYFDTWALLMALKRRNMAFGVRYVHGEVDDFEMSKMPGENGKICVNSAVVTDLGSSNSSSEANKTQHAIKFSRAIIATGAWSGEVAGKLGIGNPDGPEECQTPLPVDPRKRYRYIIHCPKSPALDCPMVCDPNGINFRREGYGGHVLVGGMLPGEAEPDISDLNPDDQRFVDVLWPILAARAPCFEECKLTNSWAGYYDYNSFDQNLIIGPHNYFKNVFFATGLSGHGVMHSAGVGRAMSELIHFGEYKTIDLSRFSFDRVVANKPLKGEILL